MAMACEFPVVKSGSGPIDHHTEAKARVSTTVMATIHSTGCAPAMVNPLTAESRRTTVRLLESGKPRVVWTSLS